MKLRYQSEPLMWVAFVTVSCLGLDYTHLPFRSKLAMKGGIFFKLK